MSVPPLEQKFKVRYAESIFKFSSEMIHERNEDF